MLQKTQCYKRPKVTKDPNYKRPNVTKDPKLQKTQITKDPKTPKVINHTNLMKEDVFIVSHKEILDFDLEISQ